MDGLNSLPSKALCKRCWESIGSPNPERMKEMMVRHVLGFCRPEKRKFSNKDKWFALRDTFWACTSFLYGPGSIIAGQGQRPPTQLVAFSNEMNSPVAQLAGIREQTEAVPNPPNN